MLFSRMLSPNTTQNQFAIRETLGQREGGRDSSLTFLVSIVQSLQPELFSVSQQLAKIARAVAAGHDQDFGDAAADQRRIG